MLKDNLVRLLGNRRNQVILGVFLLFIIAFLVFVRSGKKAPLACSPQSCPTGCCVEGSCIAKGTTLAGYSCLGNAGAGTGGSGGFLGWSTPQGQTVKNTPREVVKAIRELPEEELKAIVDSVEKNQVPIGGKAWENLPSPEEIASFIPPGETLPISQGGAQSVAPKSTTWLDTMKNNQGQYFAKQICSANGTCQKPLTADKQRGIVIVWSRFRNYLKNQDPNILKTIDADLNTLTTPNIGSPAQNDYLNCTLMYEMYQNEIFTQEQKSKIYSICNDSIFYGDDMNNFNKMKLAGQTYDADPFIDIVFQGNSIDSGLNPNPEKMIKYSSYVADLATINNWTKEAEALEIGKYFFTLALQAYSQKNEDLDDSLLGLASLKLYDATGEQKYLEFSRDFFEQKTNSLRCSNFDYCVNYLFFLDYYNDKVNDESANREEEKIIYLLLNRYYDAQKKLFFSLNKNGTYYFPVAQNAILSGILTNYSQ